MKLKMEFMLRQVAGYYVVVPVGDACVDFNGMVNLNETGAFLFERLQQFASGIPGGRSHSQTGGGRLCGQA